MQMTDILEEFRERNALLNGHFILSSGLHSPNYLQCAIALEDPSDALRYGKMIADLYRDDGIELVASPAIGGLVIGFSVAASLGVRFIWTERQNGEMTLRRGFTMKEGERALVVEDVITTGGSTRECIAALESNGGTVVAASSIIDRSGGGADVGVPRTSLVAMSVAAYDPIRCPLCAAGAPAVKPGSRVNAQ